MVKGTSLRIDPFYHNNQLDFLPLHVPSKSAGLIPSTSASWFPYLRGLDDMSSRRQKKPLLTLKLSSPSFLDSKVHDGLSDNPLYVIETANTCTVVSRYDPWEGSTKTADIRWPKRIPVKSKGKQNMQGVNVQMHGGPLRAVEHVLKPGTLSGSRSFNLPDCPHTFKWRRSGSFYHCTTSFVKGPVATLDAAASSVPPRLRVFETLPLQATWPKLDRGGVSINLLDYLLITALLLVTDGEEWVTLARPRGGSLSEGGSKSAPASVRQWRKIVYGEPLFPSLRSPKVVQVMEASEDTDVMVISPSASRPASMRQWRKIVYGEPLFPSLSQYIHEIDDISRTSTPWDDTSQSSESINYPSTPGSSSAPAHGYLDPSFYNLDAPPISQHSLECQSTPSLPEPLPHPSSALPQSSIPSPIRALPKPPIHSLSISTASTSRGVPYLHRSQSTPFLTNVSPLSSQWPPATAITTNSQFTWRTDRHADSPSPLGVKRIRLLPQPPTTPSPLSPSPHSAVVAGSLAHTPSALRSLPATPATSENRPLPPVTADLEEPRHEQTMSRSMQKAADQLVDWTTPFTQEEQDHSHASRDAGFEAPPPYNTIDFSHPPHASAPPPPITSTSTFSSSLLPSAPPRVTSALLIKH